MPGGLMQLTAYGASDLYLTGEPQVTLFKTVYRRHTAFSMEAVPQYFETNPTFSTTQRTIGRVQIERVADLMQDIYVVLDMPAIFSTAEERFQWIDFLGENIIARASVFCDGVQLDQQYSQWLHIWNELTLPSGKRQSYYDMIGYTQQMTLPTQYNGAIGGGNQPTIPKTRLYIPLPFWFCRNPGLAIPLIALQYNRIQIEVEFYEINHWFAMWYHTSARRFYEFGIADVADPDAPPSENPSIRVLQEVNTTVAPVRAGTLVEELNAGGFGPDNYFWKFVNGTTAPGGWNPNPYLLVNYIYLDEDERRRFAAVSHEYLMTQVQTAVFTGQQNMSSLELVFQKPCKEMIFAFQRNDVDYTNEWNNYTNCLYEYDSQSGNFQLDIAQYQQKVLLAANQVATCLPSVPPTPDALVVEDGQRNICYAVQFLLNGENRFTPIDAKYFGTLQPFMYHTYQPPYGVFVYSFAENPEEHQPSGTMNFSRFQRIQLNTHLRQVPTEEVTYNAYVFVHNYEVFRIIGGVGSIAFAN
jgi:hypothetical protein